MENKISKIEELNEREIADLVYQKIDAYWGKFPNLWNVTTKDDIASDVIIDLYRNRKEDGVPHIIHYYNTRGDRSLTGLISTLVYNNLRAESRIIYSTGNRNVEGRRNVWSPLSIETPIGEDDLTLGDTIKDEKTNVSSDIDYIILCDSLPDKIVEGVYTKIGDKYYLVSYKSILKDLIDGYNLTQIGSKLYKKNKEGIYCKFKGVSDLVKEMRADLQEFLFNEYHYTKDNFINGGKVL